MSRRNSVWLEEAIDNRGSKRRKSSDSSASYKNANKNGTEAGDSDKTVEKPAKIMGRRHSERLKQKQQRSLLLESNHQTNANQSTDKENCTVVSDSDDDVVAVDDQALVKKKSSSKYQLKPRCELSIGILNQFNDIKPV